MNINRLEIIRRMVQAVAIVMTVAFVPLAIFTPWSLEEVVEDWGVYVERYDVIRFDLYIALAYVVPVVGLLVTNGSMKRYFKRIKAELNETSRFCIICGKNNIGSYCTYCGTQI
jgi:hypothetical protein